MRSATFDVNESIKESNWFDFEELWQILHANLNEQSKKLFPTADESSQIEIIILWKDFYRQLVSVDEYKDEGPFRWVDKRVQGNATKINTKFAAIICVFGVYSQIRWFKIIYFGEKS